MGKAGWLVFLYALTWSCTASSGVITKCDASEGYSYFVEGGLVPKNKAGWTKDQTSKGSYLLLRDGDAFDIIFSAAVDRTISSREDGARIVPIFEEAGTYVFIVNYPRKHVEIWAFTLDSSGRGFVIFHQARYGLGFPIRKHTVFRAPCNK